MAVLVAKGYVDEDDVFELYEVALIKAADAFRCHIAARQAEAPETTHTYLKNFVNLSERLDQRNRRQAGNAKNDGPGPAPAAQP